MNAKHDINSIPLTSSELAQLWVTYMSDSMTKCVVAYFKKAVQDPDILSILDQAFNILNGNLKVITDIFNAANQAIPNGFTDEDINTNAKQLYSDTFIGQYTKLASKFALISYSNALTSSTRSDVRKFFTDRVYTSSDIYNRINDVLLEKGIYLRAPYITTSQKVEYIQKQSFMNGFWGDKRPLSAMEISHLYSNIETNMLGEALITGFAQTAWSKKVKEFMAAGKDIAMKHIETFSDLLKESNVASPSSWDIKVLESTEAPFSERLMMFHITALISFSLSSYGLAISASMRNDLALTFTKLMAEIGKYAKDGAEIMIENSWLEKAPEAINREELINV